MSKVKDFNLAGLYADIPTLDVNQEGYRYFATDTGNGYRWNGSSWVLDAVTVTFDGVAEDLATAETDTALVLAPDGAGGVEFRAEAGGSGGDVTKLATHTSSGAADIQLLSWKNDSLYDIYRVELYNILPATDNVEIELQFSKDGGSTWEASNYAWTGGEKYIGGFIAIGADSGQSYIKLATAAGNGTYKQLDGSYTLYQPGAARHKKIKGSGSYWTYAGNQIDWDVSGDWLATNAIDGIRIVASSGNISGTATIYGLTK